MPLFLIPTFLSLNTAVISQQAAEASNNILEFIVENEKSARHFLKIINPDTPQSIYKFYLLNEHTQNDELKILLDLIKTDRAIGLLSEAGCPAVADPGASIVRLAHQNNIKVIPLTGPSSIILALMGSGLNGQHFIFHGYLPRAGNERKLKIASIEKEASRKDQTQIFIEAPYRNQNLLLDLLSTCNGDTMLCIATNITAEDENIKTQTIFNWREAKPDINKKPTIFLLGK